MAETKNRTYIGIIILIIIIVFFIVILWVILKDETKFSPLGGDCTETEQCVEGLVCETSKCRVPLGGPCSTVADCVTEATECFNNVCVVTSQPLPPTTCLVNLDCRDSEICSGSVTKVNGVNRFKFDGHQTIDVSSFGCDKEVIFLLDDGTLRRTDGTTIRSQLKLTAIFEAGHDFFGIHNRKVFKLVDTSPIWRWRKVKWSPENVVYSNVSLDQQFVWLQSTRSANENIGILNPGFKGFLFKFKDRCKYPKLIRTEQLDQGIIRVYGENQQVFMNINQVTQTGTLFKFGQLSTITDIVDGAIDQNGNVHKITSKTCDQIYAIIILFMTQIYQLDRRFCSTGVTNVTSAMPISAPVADVITATEIVNTNTIIATEGL